MVNTTARWLFYFLLFQISIWTLGPTLDRHTLPHDMLEALTMGLQYQWGYNKHPLLSPWLTAGMHELFHSTGWPIYLLAQFAVALAFYCIWKLAKLMLPPWHALIATLLLVGVLFYNYSSTNFTPDTLQTPLWAMLSLCCYKAIITQSNRQWCLTGLVAGLCFLTKYQSVVIFLPILLFCICNADARQNFKKTGIYLGFGACLITIMPHLIWLYQHDFISLHYATESAGGSAIDEVRHVSYPLRLMLSSVASLGCGLILWFPLLRSNYNGDQDVRESVSLTAFQWQFLLYLGLGPWLLTIFICAIFGHYFPPRWLTPYFILWGIITIAWLKPVLTKKKCQVFLIMAFSLSLILCGLPFISVSSKLRSDAYLPNPEIAITLNQIWQQHYPTRLAYLAGSRYLVASVLPYFKEKPIPYFSWDQESSAWINERDLKKKGALFIWDQGKNYIWDHESARCAIMPDEVKQKYPTLIPLGCYSFSRLTAQKTPVVIGIAILPPDLAF